MPVPVPASEAESQSGSALPRPAAAAAAKDDAHRGHRVGHAAPGRAPSGVQVVGSFVALPHLHEHPSQYIPRGPAYTARRAASQGRAMSPCLSSIRPNRPHGQAMSSNLAAFWPLRATWLGHTSRRPVTRGAPHSGPRHRRRVVGRAVWEMSSVRGPSSALSAARSPPLVGQRRQPFRPSAFPIGNAGSRRVGDRGRSQAVGLGGRRPGRRPARRRSIGRRFEAPRPS